jgi:ribosomal protein S18 acetylase RimI-like enzyme
MKPSISILPISDEYAEDIRRAVDSVARERKYLASVTGFTCEENLAFMKLIMNGGGVQFIALDNDEVVGWCDILRRNFEGFEHVGVLGMGVLASHRGEGIGKALLFSTIEAAKSIGISRIELEVFASNERAIKLYKDHGFIMEGVTKESRMIDGVSQDIVCMAFLGGTHTKEAKQEATQDTHR